MKAGSVGSEKSGGPMCKNGLRITDFFSGPALILIKPSQVLGTFLAPQGQLLARRMQVYSREVVPRCKKRASVREYSTGVRLPG